MPTTGTSATSSTRRASPGAGSRAASTDCDGQSRERRRAGRARTTSRTTSRSSTTRRPRTRSTCRRARRAMIGQTDQANHQYDLPDFWQAAGVRQPARGELPEGRRLSGRPRRLLGSARRAAVPGGHDQPAQKLPSWKSTAVVIAYDDSDGWYDHRWARSSTSRAIRRTTPCSAPGSAAARRPARYQDRCGYGPRLPLLVVSPFARQNYVDHSITDQSSILRFIEDNWGTGRLGNQSFDAKAGSLERDVRVRPPEAQRAADPRPGNG